MFRRKYSNELAAAAFLAPNILGFIAMTIIPIIVSFYLSFTQWDLINSPLWVGLGNFKTMFADARFWQSIWNTLYFTIGTVPVGLALALFFAILLNEKIRGIYIFRTIFFLPVISSTVAVALLWRWLYADNIGLFSYLFNLVGFNAPHFITSTKWAMSSVIVMSIWKGLGYNIVLLLAGLQSIPRNYYEAAEIDGANSMKKFLHVTLPMVSPTLFFALVMSIISSFQIFDQTFVLTRGGPANATTTIVYYIYQQGFEVMKMGYACSMALILFILILIITLIQWRMQKEWVNY